MTTEQLEGIFEPEQIEIIRQAFDEAWECIEEDFGNDAKVDLVRHELASIVLSVATDGVSTAEVLRDAALYRIVADAKEL